MSDQTTKDCRKCIETIDIRATRCRHCGYRYGLIGFFSRAGVVLAVLIPIAGVLQTGINVEKVEQALKSSRDAMNAAVAAQDAATNVRANLQLMLETTESLVDQTHDGVQKITSAHFLPTVERIELRAQMFALMLENTCDNEDTTETEWQAVEYARDLLGIGLREAARNACLC